MSAALVIQASGIEFPEVISAIQAEGYTVTTQTDYSNLPTDLSTYKQVWDFSFVTPLDAATQAAFKSYVTAGGFLYAMTENPGFAQPRNDSVAQLIINLGGGPTTIGPGYAGDASDWVNETYITPSLAKKVTFAAIAEITNPQGIPLIKDSAGRIQAMAWIGGCPGGFDVAVKGTLINIPDLNWLSGAYLTADNLTVIIDLLKGVVKGTVDGTINCLGSSGVAPPWSGPTITTTTTAATTTTTAAPTTTTTLPPAKLFTLTNTGKIPVEIQSMTFTDPVGITHTANLSNLGGGSAVATNRTALTYNLRVGTPATFTVDYQNVSAPVGTYSGQIVINGNYNTTQTIVSNIVVNSKAIIITTTTTTAAPTSTTTTTAGPTSTTTTTPSPGTINTSILSTLSGTFTTNQLDAALLEVTFYNSGRVHLIESDLYTPGTLIDDFWVTGGGSTPGNNFWMRITRLVGSLNVTPSTGWIAMALDITIAAYGYPTYGQEGKWNIEIATDSAGNNIVGRINNMRFLPGATTVGSGG